MCRRGRGRSIVSAFSFITPILSGVAELEDAPDFDDAFI
jgi:hypothetical protein